MMQNRGIQILIASATIQGLCEAMYPKIKADNKINITDIPVSSQFGRESIQAMIIPAKQASMHQKRNDLLVLLIIAIFI
jgi:hypothetical protein